MDRYEEDTKNYFDRWKKEFEERAFAYSHPIEDADSYFVRPIKEFGLYGYWEACASTRHPFKPELVIMVCLRGMSKSDAEFKVAREWFDFHCKIWREHIEEIAANEKV